MTFGFAPFIGILLFLSPKYPPQSQTVVPVLELMSLATQSLEEAPGTIACDLVFLAHEPGHIIIPNRSDFLPQIERVEDETLFLHLEVLEGRPFDEIMVEGDSYELIYMDEDSTCSVRLNFPVMSFPSEQSSGITQRPQIDFSKEQKIGICAGFISEVSLVELFSYIRPFVRVRDSIQIGTFVVPDIIKEQMVNCWIVVLPPLGKISRSPNEISLEVSE